MQPRGGFVDFIVLDNGKDNRKPKRDKNNKRDDKRLHIKEEYTPREIEYKANGVDKQRVVLLRGIACENHSRANSH